MSSGSLPQPCATVDVLLTKETRRFGEFCDAVRRYRYIGLCYGAPGVGKTLSARHYAHWNTLEPLLREYYWIKPPARELLINGAIMYTPAVTNAPTHIERHVRLLSQSMDWALEDVLFTESKSSSLDPQPLPRRTELVIVDEADRLKMPGLEQLRDIYDRRDIGLVLIGMPGIEKRLARFPQLYSRVGFVHHYRTLSVEELRGILVHKWDQLGLALNVEDFTDAEAMAAIARITGGNFRLIQRLFSQIERILQINDLQLITKEVVEAARENLVIGVL